MLTGAERLIAAKAALRWPVGTETSKWFSDPGLNVIHSIEGLGNISKPKAKKYG